MENNNELPLFEMINEWSRGGGNKRKSSISELLDDVMLGQNFSSKYKPVRSRDPFLHNPQGPIIAPPDSKNPAKVLGSTVGTKVEMVTCSLTDYIDDLSKSTEQETIPNTEYDLLNFKPVAAYIIGYEDCRELLIRGMRAFFGMRYPAAASFNREDAGKALHALLEDYLTRRECWHDDYRPGGEKLLCGTERYDMVLSKFIPPKHWYLPEGHGLDFTKALTGFAMEVGEVIRSKMFDKLSSIIPGPTYDIYRTARTAGGVLLEKGPDYRVVDWMRRTGNGEWK